MYLTWVNQRRELVDKLSNGRIGYIHVPNTSYEGNRELFRGMYAYHDKEALIIDDRYNGGGFIPDVMTSLLDRKTLSYWQRSGLEPMRTPGVAHDGPKVMLINGYSSSGGDAFPYFLRKRAWNAHRNAHMGRISRNLRKCTAGGRSKYICPKIRYL